MNFEGGGRMKTVRWAWLALLLGCAEPAKDHFSVGELVQLRSGGTCMAVAHLESYTVWTVWLDRYGEEHNARVPFEVLMPCLEMSDEHD